MSKLIGIDLGTTNSCVAVMEGGESVVIPTAEGARTTPSVVAFTKNGERLVGQAAKRQAAVNVGRTVSSIKREMGTDYKITIDGKKFSPPEISAMILGKLKKDAENYLGEPVTDAVITVPAYFSDSQRQATKDAGLIAGLNVQRIINEPTAAALAYGADKEGSQKVMVYDLGGGTFDVSILDISNGVIEVLATAGNNRLGGDDFDQCLTDYIVKEFKKQNRIDLTKDQTALMRVREAAEKAKIELSGMISVSVNLPFLCSGPNGPLHLEMTINRAKFNELTNHLVDATTGPVNQALADSGITIAQLNKVILVGGSTRIPAVQETVKRLTGKEPFKGINPDECVAMGASLQGGVLTGQVQGLLLLDVTPLSLGLETVGGVFTRLIDRNSTIPTQKSQIFTTAASFQRSVDIHVLQGEREMARYNKTLGRFRLDGIRRAPRGVPQIEVTFRLDANGIVNVSAKDLGTGKMQEITITSSSNLSKEDIDAAIRDAQRYAAEDNARKNEAEIDNQLENLIYQANGRIKKIKNKDDKHQLDEAIKNARRAKKSKDTQQMTAAYDNLTAVLARCGGPVAEDPNGEPADNGQYNDNQYNNGSYNSDYNNGPYHNDQHHNDYSGTTDNNGEFYDADFDDDDNDSNKRK